jgi:hypothetical protein
MKYRLGVCLGAPKKRFFRGNDLPIFLDPEFEKKNCPTRGG